MKKFSTTEEYLASYPACAREMLESLRQAIREAVPDVTETIGYGMPAFRYKGRTLVYIGAFKDHAGFFPTASGVAAFQKELSGYSVSKGTVRFPFGEPLPLDLVKRIAAFRRDEIDGKR